MKKIGIITFHASHNCGSMMQAYAIQKQVEKLGYENEIIDFQNEGQKDMYAVVHRKKTIKNFIKNTLLLFSRKKIRKQWNDYEKFKNKTFKLSKTKYSNSDELKETNNKYDCFISGADQIWNITIKDADDSYFLDFVEDEKIKIAYAPSFGAKNILDVSNDPQKYARFLNRYDYLSIRENNGKKWIKDLIGKTVPVVLDPTLLLDSNEYENLIEKNDYDGKYIFYYSPTYSRKIDKFVKKISKKYKLPVIVWNSREYYMKKEYLNGFILPKKLNPGVYLDLIKNAEIIITTSFHGTIFSTVYRKKFFVIKNGNMYTTDDRVLTLINQLGIKKQLIEPNFNDDFDYLGDIDYSEYEKNLIKLRKNSIEFLKESLSNE